jgi:3-deoxy-7-phosphoheptulonate synthase
VFVTFNQIGVFMILVLKKDVTEEIIDQITRRVEKLGLAVHVSRGVERTIIGVIGDEDILRAHPMDSFPGVEKILPILKPYKLCSREFKKENTVVNVDGEDVGGRRLAIMAGPCTVEGRDSLMSTAEEVKKSGARFLRGGAFKPRTSPYSFQGLGKEGLEYLKEARERFGLKIVTELMDPRDIELMVEYADIIQIGARNMQNFRLLKEMGQHRKPVLLKRGLSASIKEWLMSAEYIMAEGNYNVILCERGIRTFEDYTRNTLDLGAVAAVKELSHLPVVVDPSHGLGRWRLVPAMCLAAVAAGADGLLVEVHDHPGEALCDGGQSLTPSRFASMMGDIERIAGILGREI